MDYMDCIPPNVAQVTMQSLMNIENAGRRPHAIGYKIIRRRDKKVFRLTKQPATVQEAIAWAKWFDANGYAYDAGYTQVHSSNFSRYGLNAETAFQACPNIWAGAAILHDCYARALPRYGNEQVALRHALSCYQSGNFSTGFKTGYVDKVVKSALNR